MGSTKSLIIDRTHLDLVHGKWQVPQKVHLDGHGRVVLGRENLVVGVVKQSHQFTSLVRNRVRSLDVIGPAVADRTPGGSTGQPLGYHNQLFHPLSTTKIGAHEYHFSLRILVEL